MTNPGELLAQAYEGRHGALRGEIAPRLSAALTAMVRREQPRQCLEIGMAYGMSALAILAGLPADGTLTSVDPFQTEHFGAAGKGLVGMTDRAASHTLIEQPDYLALPRLLDEGRAFDFAYIDGMHTFDYVALDAFYIDKLLKVGGVVGFNDCGFRSVHKFLRFFLKHRDYREIDAGLSPDYRGGNAAISLLRRIERRSNQDRYFRKCSGWEPEHNFFRRF